MLKQIEVTSGGRRGEQHAISQFLQPFRGALESFLFIASSGKPVDIR